MWPNRLMNRPVQIGRFLKHWMWEREFTGCQNTQWRIHTVCKFCILFYLTRYLLITSLSHNATYVLTWLYKVTYWTKYNIKWPLCLFVTLTHFSWKIYKQEKILDIGDKNSPHWTTNIGMHQFKNNFFPPGFSFIKYLLMLISCKASFTHILLEFLNLCYTKLHIFDAKGHCFSSIVGYQGTCFGFFILCESE